MSELLTPLNNIRGYAELLSDEAAEGFHPEYAKAILVTVDRLEGMRKATIEYLNDYYSRTRQQNPKP